MADSTEVSINRLYRKFIRMGRLNKRRMHDKLHILACYYPDYGDVPIISARWGEGYSYDSANLLKMVRQLGFFTQRIFIG